MHCIIMCMTGSETVSTGTINTAIQISRYNSSDVVLVE